MPNFIQPLTGPASNGHAVGTQRWLGGWVAFKFRLLRLALLAERLPLCLQVHQTHKEGAACQPSRCRLNEFTRPYYPQSRSCTMPRRRGRFGELAAQSKGTQHLQVAEGLLPQQRIKDRGCTQPHNPRPQRTCTGKPETKRACDWRRKINIKLPAGRCGGGAVLRVVPESAAHWTTGWGTNQQGHQEFDRACKMQARVDLRVGAWVWLSGWL